METRVTRGKEYIIQSESIVSAIAKTSSTKIDVEMRSESTNNSPARPPPNFLELPPELRTMVLEFLLVKPEAVEPYVELGYYWPPRIFQRSTNSLLAIRSVCKQANAEASSIYFGRNTFFFSYLSDMEEILRQIGQQNRSCIKRIKFELSGKARVKALQLLGKCTSLQNVEIILSWDTMHGARRTKRETLLAAPGMNQLLKLRGLQNVTVTNAVSEYYRPHLALRDTEEVSKLLKTELCKPKKMERGTWNQ
ncbi:hypothetical protein BGZ60DRAFT_567953 [Tricladium varicosporioides]|nr:hypothetical protein BGZ60DRAFT_567953 [Hymenoscyphus varicosporioides]